MSLINRNEIRRLEKAAREKDKKHLVDWADSLERQIIHDISRQLDKKYNMELSCSLDVMLTAVAYTLYFSDETYINKENMAEFMTDLYVTMDMYRLGEYKPEDYEKQLSDVGIIIEKYDYDKIYKQFLNTMDNDLVRYLRLRPRKIITICGNYEFKDIMQEEYIKFTIDGDIVFTNFIDYKNLPELDDVDMAIKVLFDKILISDKLYVVNKDNEIDNYTKLAINYAQEHNKEIQYYENIN